MNLYNAADAMIETSSVELSNCFGLAIPTTYANGKAGEKVLRFGKAKPTAIVEAETEAADTQDTLWIDGAEDHPAGSQGRIELLRAYYEIEESKPEPRSASVLNDEEFSHDLIEAIINCSTESKETPMMAFIRGELRQTWKAENLDG